MRLTRIETPTLVLSVVLLMMILLPGRTMVIAADEPADDPAIEVSPERATAVVAPVDVTLGGMPPLETLSPALEVLDPVETVHTAMASAPLPMPEIPRDAVEESIGVAGEQVFFNATLGGGSVNSILGSINVFRLGEGPEFRIGYDHRASDGFDLRSPGSGYFRQENTLETWLRFGADRRVGVETDLGYRDSRFGLQRQPKYYSAETRELYGLVVGEYRWDPRSSTAISLEMQDLSRVLATSTDGELDPPVDSERERHYRIAPELSARLEWPRFTLVSALDYSGRFAAGVDLDSSSTAGVSLSVEGIPVDGLTLTGYGATRYRFNDQAYFPVELGMDYSFRERWNLRIAGGYRVIEQSYGDLWDDYPVAATPEIPTTPPPPDQVFFSEGELTVNVVPGFLQLIGGGGLFYHTDHLFPLGYDRDNARYPVIADEFLELNSRTGLVFSVGDRFSTGVSWLGRWEDRPVGVPRHVAELNLRSDWNRVVGEATVVAPIDGNTTIVPAVGGSIRYGIARDVELRIFVSDLLAPLDEEGEGRTRRGVAPSPEDPFIEPGFEIGASIRVSF
jgi:hypothetical protein